MAVIHWLGGVNSDFNTAGNWGGGVVPLAGDDAIIDLAGAAVVSSADNSVNTLAVIGTASLSIASGTFTVISGSGSGNLAGNVTVADGATLSIGGTIVNSGTINESSAGTTTKIVLNQTTNILQGGGQVILSANANNQIIGAKSTFLLDNQNNTISGSGQLGSSFMALSNEGVINANKAAAALTVDTAGNVIINAGTMEATGGGSLTINSPVNNVGGTIEAVGAGSIVFLQASVTGGTVFSSGGGQIKTPSGNITLDGLGLHPVTNGTALPVLNGNTITLLGNIINNGTINLNSAGANTDLRVGSPIVTLQGKGAITLTNQPNNRIFGNNGAFQLINQGNTISGAGQLGAAQLTFSNAGLVDANQATALIFNTSGETAFNTGTLQASNTGGLFIQNTGINNAGGTVQALVAKSHVDLGGSSIQGGILATANGGVIQVVGGNATLDGQTAGLLGNRGTVVINDQTQLSLVGTINNTGTISQQGTSTTGSTQIRIASQTVTLTGGGRVTMSNNVNNLVLGTSGSNTLINANNAISGAGQLGDGQMTLVNQGQITADQKATLAPGANGQLVVNTQGNYLINTGLMADTNTGGLVLQNTTIKNAGGTILATGGGSHVDVNSSTIEGGIVTDNTNGIVQVAGAGNSAGLDGISIGQLTNQGTFLADNGARLDIAGTINNTGTILVNQVSTTGNTDLRVTGQTTTLTGGGKVVLSDANNNRIYASNSSFTLVNLNNTISGAGQFGGGSVGAPMFLVNKSTIVADQAPTAVMSGQLVLNTNGDTITNTGTLKDTGSGGLVIQSVVNNAGGTIESAGAGSHVDLGGGNIQGGTLITSGGGVIQTVGGNGVLDGITFGVINNKGSVQVIDATTLSLVGTINNTGTIGQNSLGSSTDVRIASTVVTLQGGGVWQMSDGANNRVFGNNSTFKLVNVDNTISGSGQFGGGSIGAPMFVVNQSKGVINANGKAALVWNTGGDIATNTGLVESTGSLVNNGGLVLQTTLNNAGGTVLAAGPLAHIDLQGGYIEGGTLKSTGGGVVQTLAGSSGALDGITSGPMTNNGTVLVNDNSTLTLVGSIVNNGTIFEDAISNNNNTDIRIGGPTVTLSGPGFLTMSDNSHNRLFGNSAPFTLINQSNIQGAGQFGGGNFSAPMEFTNAAGALLQGNGTNVLLVNLGSGNGINNGIIGATGVGGVELQSGIFTNNGFMNANNGSSLTFDSGATNTNLNEGDLVGGIWRAIATGQGATLSMTGGAIVRDAAVLVLSGDKSVIQAGTGSGVTPYQTVETTLNTVTANGQLQVLNNRGYSSKIALTDSGIVQLGGGTFQVDSADITPNLNITGGGKLFGFGSVNDAVTSNGLIEAQGGLLAVTGAITGSGSQQIDNAATFEVVTSSTETATYASGAVGTLKLDAPAGMTGSIAKIGLNDVIDVAGTVTSALVTAGVLDVKFKSGPDVFYNVSPAVGVSFATTHFGLTSDGGTGTNLTLLPGAPAGAPPAGGGSGPSGPAGNPADPPVTWTGSAADKDFNNKNNWDTTTVPGVSDTAIIVLASAVVNSAVGQVVNAVSLGATDTLNITAGTFNAVNGTDVGSNAGTINVADGATLQLGGTITNSGTIGENSTGTSTQLVFTQTTNLLQGGGNVMLSANANNLVFASNPAFQLINANNTISGAGDLGDGKMTLINQGVVNANQSSAALTIDTAGNTITNSGTLEATKGGTLNILSSVAGGTIEAIGAGSTVFLPASVSAVLIASGGGTIVPVSGSFSLDGLGLHPVTVAAPLQVSNGNNVTLFGNITNTSTINLNSTGNNTDLRIGSAIVNLLGKGTINLSNNGNNRIFGTNGAFSLINQGNTITGAGQLGAAQLTFSNAGVVNSNQTNALILNTSGNYVINTGIMQSSSTGGLVIQNTAVNDAGGTVQALAAGSHVDLSGGTIWGGTLKTANGGVIQTVGGNGSLDGITFGVLNNQGSVQVNDQTILSLAGVINNTGTIKENEVSTNGSTQIRIASQTVTLQGKGKLVLSNKGNNLIFGNSASNTLINLDNTISGAGQLGNGQMTFVNSGTVNADQVPTFTTSGQLVLNTSGNLATNTGTLEATNSGGLQIASTNVVNTGGIVLATGLGHVDLAGSTLFGGTLVTTGGGVIQTVSGNGGLDGITAGVLNNTGLFKVNDLTTLSLSGVINNTGTIFQDQISRNGATDIRIASTTVTLQGGGKLQMSNNGANRIFANNSLFQLINVDNTISGSGQIGGSPVGAPMFLINQSKGVINANQSVGLLLNSGGNIITNGGLLEDTGTGGLQIQATAVNNTGGTILSAGANSHVDIIGGASIQGGILTTSGGGVVQIGTADSGTLDGINNGVLNNQGNFVDNDGATLNLVGIINNTGTITQAGFSANSSTDIRIANQTVTLQGGGKLVMSDDSTNRIFGNNSAFQFVNVNNTISGAGVIGGAPVGAPMFLINQKSGVINANVGNALVISGGGDIVTNMGLMESTSLVPLNGGLVISGGSLNNTGTVGETKILGTIAAVGSLAHVDLSSAYIEGGLLTTSGGGVIQTVLNTTSSLDGITSGQLTNSGTINVNDTSTLQLVGTINNTGTINQAAFSANSNTDIRLIGTTTLTGFGVLQMSDNPNNRFFANNSTYTLINFDTIRGAGQFGGGNIGASMNYINNGQIAQQGANTLLINLASDTGVNNASGLIGAQGAGGLVFASGFFTNNGTMTVNDGSSITYQPSASNTNLNEGDLVGGTWRALSTGHGATLSITGGPVIQDAATIVLSGAGSVFQAGNGTIFTPVEQTLTTVVAGGQLQVLANRGYNTGLDLEDDGVIQLGGGTFQANSLAIGVGGNFNGFGTVQGSAFNGSFSAGNTGFSSDYAFVPSNGTVHTNPTQYSITTNPATGFTNGYLSYGDHTTGSGNMLFVDGSTSSSNAFWRENVPLAAGTQYTFTYFATSADGGILNPSNEPTIRTLVNGGAVGVDTLISTQGGSPWQQVTTNFTTGAAGLYTVSMVDLNTVSGTNDFTVDDISLSSTIGTGVVTNAGTLEAAGGTLTMQNVVVGSGTMQADAGSTLALNGAGVNSAGTAVNNGTISIATGDSLVVTVAVDPTSTGVFLLNNSSVLEVAVDKGTTNAMSFIGTGQLSIDHVASFGNNIGLGTYTGPQLENFGPGDAVQLKDLNFAGASAPVYTPATGLLQLANGATKATLLFDDSTLGGTKTFQIANDGGGHVLLTET